MVEKPTNEPGTPIRVVESIVSRVQTRMRLGLGSETIAGGGLWLLILLVTIGLLDVGIGLSAAARWIAMIGLTVAVLWFLLLLLVRLLRIRREVAASNVDRAMLGSVCGATGSETRSALEFAERTGSSELLTRTIAKRIGAVAAQRLVGLRAARVPTGYRTSRALMLIACLGLVALTGQLMAGDIVQSVGKRLLDPTGGHPRWSPIDVSITTTRIDPSDEDAPDGLWIGDSVRISTVIERVPEATYATVMIARGDAPPEPLPLDLFGSGVEEDPSRRGGVTLRAIAEPTRVWVELRGGPGTPQRWRAASREIVLDPDARPRLRDAQASITPLAYTGIADRTERWSGRTATRERKLTLTQGTTLELEAAGSVPLTEIRTGGLDPVSSSASADRADAVWICNEAGDFELEASLVGADGRGDRVRIALTVIPDAAPQADIAWPAREEVVALEGATVPLRLSAADDYAVTSVTVLELVEGDPSRARRIDVSIASDTDPKKLAPSHSVDTASLGAVAGDTVEVRTTVTDNRPSEIGGAQTTASRTLRIRIVDAEEFERLLRQELGQQAADAFREKQQGEPCPDCQSGECDGECNGTGPGSGSGSGKGSGSGTGEANGGGTPSGSPGSRGDGGSSGSPNGSGAPGDLNANQSGEGSGSGEASAEPSEPESADHQQSEARPWDGDRFFDGQNSDQPADQSQPDAQSNSAQADQQSEGDGTNSNEDRRGPDDQPEPEQPLAPPLAGDPDGRDSSAGSIPSDAPEFDADAEASVPERYRDLVRAYYERRAKQRKRDASNGD